MTLPCLIIPGARKSASTTFFSLLSTHPEVYIGENKEPHFFVKDDLYEQGVRLYQTYYQQHQGESIVADGSQSYMPFDFVPQRIRQTLGLDVRFIFLLRHPVDRVVSAFTHESVRPGRDTRQDPIELLPTTWAQMTLTDLLAYEKRTTAEGFLNGTLVPRHPTWTPHNYPFNYFYASCYAQRIRPYLDIFPINHFLFLTFREVTRNQVATLEKVAHFLEIDLTGFPRQPDVHVNVSLMYKNRVLTRLLRPLRYRLRSLFPYKYRRPLAQLEARWLQRKPAYRFPEDVYEHLQNCFQPEMMETETLTNLDLKAWYTFSPAIKEPL